MPCHHEFVRTGLVRTWCKYCNVDAYHQNGEIVIEKAPMRTINVGLHCQFREYTKRWAYNGTSVRVKDLEILPPYLRINRGHWTGLGGQYTDAAGKELNSAILENFEHIDLITDASNPTMIILDVAFESGWTAMFYVKLTEPQVVAFTRELNALP